VRVIVTVTPSLKNKNKINNNNKYILLVDNDQDTVFTFDLYLKSIGYTTVSFVNC
jgi:hypothetical protein